MQILKKQDRRLSLSLAFALPVISMLVMMIIRGCEPFGDKSMLYSDMYHQYYPFWVELRRAMRSGQPLLYTWSVGMGMDYLSLISYYLASPLNLLAFLVPESLTLEFFSLLVPIKLGLAGLFFAYFLNQVFDRKDISIVLFGAMYGLCAWALGYQWNVMWLDSFAMLPLMALGTIWLLRDKKFGLYTGILFLSIFSNYYIGFFVCIFVLLLFFVYEICRWQGFKLFFLDLVRIGVFTILAIGLTAILELPALAGLQNTQSSVNTFPTEFRLNIADEDTIAGLFDAMRQVAGNTLGGVEPTWKEGLPNLYCGVGSVLLAFLFLTGTEIRIRDKICAVFLLLFFMVSFIIRQLDYIWHGFHFTNMIPYRFSFLFSFVVLYMAYRAYTMREAFRLWQLILGGVLSASLIFLSEDKTEPIFLVYNIGFLLLYLLTLGYGLVLRKPPENATKNEWKEFKDQLSRNRQFSTACFAAVMVLEIIMNMINFGSRFSTTGVSNYPKGLESTEAVIGYMKEAEKDNLFYRAEVTHTQTLNDGALNDYNGVGTFTSSANVRVTEFMKALGFGAKNTYNRYAYEQGSPVANLFLNLKYLIERDGDVANNAYFDTVYTEGTVSLLENNAYLPLGFLARPELADVDFSYAERFEFQNVLFSAATGVEEDVWATIFNPEITGEGITVDAVYSGRCNYSNATAGSAVVYNYTAHRNGFLCLYLDVTDRNSYTVSVNGEQVFSESLSLPQMIAVSDVMVGDTITVRLNCKSGEKGLTILQAAILDGSAFRVGVEALQESTLELTSFSTTKVEGTINCARDGLLYTSIPQDGNWRVYVDGHQVEHVLVGEAMIGVMMTQGDHDVRFEYHNTAFSYGWKISLICAMALAIAAYVYHPNRKRGKFMK